MPAAPDAIAAFVLLGATGLLARACWLVARGLLPLDSTEATALHAIVLFWSWIVFAGIVLGSVGQLAPIAFTTLVASTALTAIVWAQRSGPKPDTDRCGWAIALGWAAFLSWWIGTIIACGLLQFPDDWDSLMYHIPLVDQWLRGRGLVAPNCAVWYFPGNNELLELWLVGLFSGDFLVSSANLPSAMVLALGTIELTRTLGLRPISCYIAGFSSVANYVVIRQSVNNQNDLAVAALYVAGIAYSCRYLAHKRTADVCLAALCMGLLAGVKYYALGYAAIAGTALLCASVYLHGRRCAWHALLAGVAGFLATGAYWYARNGWLTGTPVYPRGIVPSHDMLEEIRPDVWSSTLLGSRDPDVFPLLVQTFLRSLGIAHVLACAALPIAVSWLCLSSLPPPREPSYSPRRASRLMLAMLVAASTAMFGVTPFCVETTPGTLNMLRLGYLPARFGLAAATLAVVAFVVLLDDLYAAVTSGETVRRRGHALRVCGVLPLFAFAALTFSQLFTAAYRDIPGDRWVGVAIAPVVFAFGAAVFGAWHVLRAPVFRVVVSVAALGGLSLLVQPLGARWHGGFAKFYDKMFNTSVFTTLEAEYPDDTVVCATTYRYYPAIGSRRQFDVGRPFWIPTYESLLAYVREASSSLVVSMNVDRIANGRYVKTKLWMDEHAKDFELLHTDNGYSLYRVASSGPPDRAGETEVANRNRVTGSTDIALRSD